MSKIFENPLFNFCGNTFLMEDFSNNIKSKGQSGLHRTVVNNIIVRESYFLQILQAINSLSHAYKFYNEKNYKKDKKKIIYYNAKEGKKVFEKYPYLQDMSLLSNILEITWKQYVIEEFVESRGYPADSLNFVDNEYFEDFLEINLNNIEKIELEYRYNCLLIFFENAPKFLISNEQLQFYRSNAFFLRSSGSLIQRENYRFNYDFQTIFYNYKIQKNKDNLKDKVLNL